MSSESTDEQNTDTFSKIAERFDFLKLITLSDAEVMSLCDDNSYYYNICNTEKFFEARTKYFYPEYYNNLKKFSESWKDFYTSINNLTQFVHYQLGITSDTADDNDDNNNEVQEDSVDPEVIKEKNTELILHLIETNNYIGLRILYYKIPESKNAKISNRILRKIIQKREYELFELLVTNSLSVDNQVLLVNTFPLEYIEKFSSYLSYPNLLYEYNLDNLAITQYLVAMKLPDKKLTYENTKFLANKAAEDGKYDTLVFITQSDIWPSPKHFLIALRKGNLEIVSYLIANNFSYYYNTTKDDLIFAYRNRVLETIKFLTSPTTFNLQITIPFIDEICYYGSVSDIEFLHEFSINQNKDLTRDQNINFGLYPSYQGVVNAIVTENSEVIKFILNLNLITDKKKLSYINKNLNSYPINSLDMLKWYSVNGFVFDSMQANISAVGFCIENVEFLAAQGILPNIIGANELVIRCNEENYKYTVFMLEWLAEHAILPNSDVYLETSLDFQIRQWLQRHGISR